MQESVKENRSAYIGGSDIAVILGISPFKTRWQLLREKAGLEEDTFEGNKYTAYGNAMEGKIRDYLNEVLYQDKTEMYFKEGKHVEEGDPIGFREHTDGENKGVILEIKTTGGDIPWRVYEVQLLWYMMRTFRNVGELAVYIRPDDMSEEFDPDRLIFKHYNLEDYEDLTDRIQCAVQQFIVDLARIKENPFLEEQDFMPMELVEVSRKVIQFEERLLEIKEEEKKIKAEKQKLFDAMLNANVKKWETLNGYKITRVDAIPSSEKQVEEFDEELFMEQNPELYKQYIRTLMVTVSGKAGYVKITPPKGGK